MTEVRTVTLEELVELQIGLVGQTVASLKSLGGDSLMLGDDSGLINVWEEICVQVRGEQSPFWDSYLTVIDDFLRGGLETLSPEEREALWLMTDPALDWEPDSEEAQSPPICDDDIVEDLRASLLSRADDDDSPRVERFLYGFDESEDEEEEADGDEEEDESDGAGLGHADRVNDSSLSGYQRFSEKIDEALVREGISNAVGRALLTDFMRALHEVFTKAGRDQTVLLAQVRSALGVVAAQSLANVIKAATELVGNIPHSDETPLEYHLNRIYAERGLDSERGRRFVESFVIALDKERFDSFGQCSALNMMYWPVGDEATYHLGGLLVGDDRSDACVELSYMDSRLGRFRTMIDQWEMEMKWDREE